MVKKKHKANPPSLTRGKYAIRDGKKFFDHVCNFRNFAEFQGRMHELMVFDSNAEAKEYALNCFDNDARNIEFVKLSEIASTRYEFTHKADVSMTLVDKYEDDSFADAKSRYLRAIGEQVKTAQKELTALSKEFFKKRDALLAEIQKCDSHHDTFVRILKDKQWVV